MSACAVAVPVLLTIALPATSSFSDGEVVPIPTLPLSKIVNNAEAFESCAKKVLPVVVPPP